MIQTVPDALSQLERAVLTPIVEGELEMRAAEMHAAIRELDDLVDHRAPLSKRRIAAAGDEEAVMQDVLEEEARLQLQLRELTSASEQLMTRASKVEPDEKQLGDEVEALVAQARQFTIDFRQHEQARGRLESLSHSTGSHQ